MIDIVNILNYNVLAFKCHWMVGVRKTVESLSMVFEQQLILHSFKYQSVGTGSRSSSIDINLRAVSWHYSEKSGVIGRGPGECYVRWHPRQYWHLNIPNIIDIIYKNNFLWYVCVSFKILMLFYVRSSVVCIREIRIIPIKFLLRSLVCWQK